LRINQDILAMRVLMYYLVPESSHSWNYNVVHAAENLIYQYAMVIVLDMYAQRLKARASFQVPGVLLDRRGMEETTQCHIDIGHHVAKPPPKRRV
jgi:hypothetical protein